MKRGKRGLRVGAALGQPSELPAYATGKFIGALAAMLFVAAFLLGTWLERSFGTVPAIVGLAVVLCAIIAGAVRVWRMGRWICGLILVIGAIGYPLAIWIVLTTGF